MKKLKQRKGITLIALVITIVVLLILTGITINLTIGQDGIITRAEQAGKNYTEAAEKEKTEIAEFTDLTDKVIDKVTQKYHTMVNGVPVPKGFEHIAGTKETGFVIKDITTNADGTPTDTNGNEFVWVPCSIDGTNGSIKYDRYAFLSFQPDSGIDTETNSKKIKYSLSEDYVFIENMPIDEEISVQTYGGFYIGRYESGITGYDINIEESDSNNLTQWTGYTNGKLVVQKEQQVWNYITREMAKKVSEDLYTKEKGDSVNSKLCSSYAWDTAVKFIETKMPGYSTNSTVGNYNDKSATLGKPAKTGATEAVNNIYDMGGNVYEWTTEKSSYKSIPCTFRGGSYDSNSSGNPAGYRICTESVRARQYIAFRTTLYL